jgi:RimJ/RimL family protein N-acetyltransferase
MAPELQTPRLVLRPLDLGDADALFALCSDPVVMEHFPATLTRAESDVLLGKICAGMDERGFGVWAVVVPDVTPFAGFVGLSVPGFIPGMELAWRLAAAYWGRGYAREAARAAATFAFETLDAPEVVAFTTPMNRRSLRVMEALGMERDEAADFDHPRVPEGHRLRRHVVYRLARPEDRDRGARSCAERFAAALDADEFEVARPLLAPECVYEVRGETLVGRDAILRSYAAATRRARSAFERVAYESAVEATPGGARVRFVDVLGLGGREHRHTSRQHLTLGPARTSVTRIVHEDLPGEREALAAFVAAARPAAPAGSGDLSG